MTPTNPILTCWSTIGVSGDGTCPTLAEVIHCRNCSVFVRAGQGFLDRDAPSDYALEWTEILAKGERDESSAHEAFILFRIESEWFALPASFVRVVAPVKPHHRIPHRSDRTLLGLVNVRGELELCICPHALLGLDTEPRVATDRASAGSAATKRAPGDANPLPQAAERMLVVGAEREKWVFRVDGLHGLERIPREAIREAPVTVAEAANTCSRRLFDWKGVRVAVLDTDRLIGSLRKRLP